MKIVIFAIALIAIAVIDKYFIAYRTGINPTTGIRDILALFFFTSILVYEKVTIKHIKIIVRLAVSVGIIGLSIHIKNSYFG